MKLFLACRYLSDLTVCHSIVQLHRQCVRDGFDDVLYKLMYYLVTSTYLLTNDKTKKCTLHDYRVFTSSFLVSVH